MLASTSKSASLEGRGEVLLQLLQNGLFVSQQMSWSLISVLAQRHEVLKLNVITY